MRCLCRSANIWAGMLVSATMLGYLASTVFAGDEPVAVLTTPRSTWNGAESAPVITAMALKQGGKYMAAAGDDHLVRIWDLSTHRVTSVLAGHLDWVRDVEFVPGSDQLVSVGTDGRILTWHLGDQQPRTVMAKTGSAIFTSALTQDGTYLVVGGFECPIMVLDKQSGEILHKVEPTSSVIRDIVTSPSSTHAAVAGRDGEIEILRLSDGQSIAKLSGHQRSVRAMMFDRDGRHIISAGDDHTLRIWDAESAREVKQLAIGGAKVMSMAIVGEYQVATGCSDNVIRVWDWHSNQLVGELRGHTGTVSTLVADGTHLYSSGYDTTICVWQLPITPSRNEPAGQAGLVDTTEVR